MKLHSKRALKEDSICEYCGKKFSVSKNRHYRFCSKSCASKYNSQNRPVIRTGKICPICGKKFFAKSGKQKCCSVECGRKFIAQKNTKPTITRICPICGKEFIVPKQHINTRTCSRTCGGKFARKNYRQSAYLPH